MTDIVKDDEESSSPIAARLSKASDEARAPSDDDVGGIDLNPVMLDLQIKRDENGVPLPLPQQPIGDMKIDGFYPVIINVTPIPSLPALLGMAEGEEIEISTL